MSDLDALLHDFQSITEPLSLEELFPLQQHTELEIGCGDGGFLFEYAQRHSNRNFLGIERLLGRVRKLSKRVYGKGLLTFVYLGSRRVMFSNISCPNMFLRRCTFIFPIRGQKTGIVGTVLSTKPSRR